VTLLSNPVNRGPGAAFARGFEHLASRLQATDWLVTLEGDNTSRRELLRHMFRRVDEGYDVVLASPYLYGGGITNTSPLRVFISHIANAFVKEFLGVHGIVTVSSFFRLYRGSVILRLQRYYGSHILERRGFECMIELLLKMIYLRTTISEVPMVLDTSLRVGTSKMKIRRTIMGYLALSRRLRAWQLQAAGAEAEAVPEPLTVGTPV
jgi:dolichol-phosphate mannosyltransferase